VTGAFSTAGVVAAATARDLLRRPATIVAAAALVAFLGALPLLGSPAASPRDNRALAVELGFTTLAISTTLSAGLLGVRTAGGGEVCTSAEFLAAPVRVGGILLGRVVGIAGVLAFVLIAVGAATAVLWAALDLAPETVPASALAMAGCGILVGAATFAAIGLVAGAYLPIHLAAVAIVALFVASRTIAAPTPGESGSPSFLTAAILPAHRLDLAREVAFDRPVSPESHLLAVAACASLTAASLLVASRRIGRRETAPA
jgi:hypothetical protein